MIKNPRVSFAQRQARFVQKYAVWILMVLALATAMIFPYAMSLKLHANFMDLLPPEAASVADVRELRDRVGGTSYMIAVIESPDEETARVAADRFGDLAASFPEVEYVDNRTSQPAFESRKLLFLTLDGVRGLKTKIQELIGYYRRKNNPFYIDLLDEEVPQIDVRSFELEEKVSRIGGFSAREEGSFMRVVLVKPRHPLSDFVQSQRLFDQSSAVFKDIQKELKAPVTLGLTGPYKTRYDEYRTIYRDVRVTGILTVILLILIMLVSFRNLRSMGYAYLPLAVGILWTCAFTHLAIGYLNLITAFLLSILMGMGIDYALHLLVSIEDDLRSTRDPEKAVERTYSEITKPLLSSVSTTAMAFFVMTISEFEGFRHFGIIAGAGILLCFGILYYGLPSLVIVGEKLFPRNLPGPAAFKPTSKGVIYTIVAAGLVFSGLSLTQINRVKFNYNFADLEAKGATAIELAERIGKHFGIHLNPVVLMTPERDVAGRLARDINDYVEAHPDTALHFAASVLSHVPRDQPSKIEMLREIDALLEKHNTLISKLDPGEQKQIQDLRAQLQPAPLRLEDIPAGIQQQYEGTDQKISAVFVYPRGRILDGQEGKRFVRELRSLKLPEGVKIAGEPVIYVDILTILERDTPRVLLISFFVVLVLLFLHFKRPDHVFWVLMPVLLGFLWMMGAAGLAGFRFNYFNVAILPSILGVGVDNGIYIFHRYREERREDFYESMRKTAKGVFLASVSTMAAFASICFARHMGMASMGKLGFIGFSGNLLSSIFFVPALIQFFELKYHHLFRRETA